MSSELGSSELGSSELGSSELEASEVEPSEVASPESAKRQGEVVVSTVGLSKCYHVYARPQDRLRQFFTRGDRRYYKEFWALRDVDLTVLRGETLGIVGKNGAGKSTLLQLIAGTLKPTAGQVHLHGRLTALLELGSGFHHDFTGRENIYVAGALLGLAREQMDERMERIESFADIGEFLDRPVKTYSKGMFARLSFSVYANLDPEVFIVDEALAVGDARFRHKCMYRFKQMQEQGVAIIYVSHDAASMKHLCNRVAWIEQGCLQQVGDPSPVVDDYLNHLFHGQKPKAAPASAQQAVRGDDELGSRSGKFTLCQLLDQDAQPSDHITGGDECIVRLRFQNDTIAADSDPLILGFSISNARGLAIAGANTISNDVEVPLPPQGEATTISFRFQMPPLVPGSYAISATAVTLDASGTTDLLHLVTNAIMFQVSSARKVFGLVGLNCHIELD